jgi:hypothetical protein
MYYREYYEDIETKGIFIHDLFHNMDLSDIHNVKIYNFYKLHYIAAFEGEERRAYDDAVGSKHPYKYANKIFAAGRKPIGSITVGAGFNMDRPDARAEWDKILGDEVSFDDVYSGSTLINNQQLKRLLKYSVDPREAELVKSYKEVWSKVRPNEKIAVLSAYYNGPRLVKTNTRFFANLKKYIETSDPKYLKKASIELGERSCKDPQLISRRQLEAKLLDSTNCPFYIKPGEDIVPHGPLRVILGEARVPVGLEKHVPAVQDSEFIIWRTKLDSDVRKTHLAKEGVVYHKTMVPYPKEHGCRCEYAPVPNNLLIIDKNQQIVSIQSWIRYGGASTIALKLNG